MSVSIKVAVRCRPFTIDDHLGVNLTQCGEEEGEVRHRFERSGTLFGYAPFSCAT